MKFLAGFLIFLAFMLSQSLSYDDDYLDSTYAPNYLYDYNGPIEDPSGDDSIDDIFPTEPYRCGRNPDPAWNCNCLLECPDDEMNCSDPVKFPRVLKCNNGDGYIFMPGHCTNLSKGHITDGVSRFCDGVAVCNDGSDEPNGTFGFKCHRRPEWPACTVPQDFLEKWKDEEVTDANKIYAVCPHQADVCYNNNTFNQSKCFQCADGTLISTKQVCDGLIDCKDISDECLCLNISQDTKKFCAMQNHAQATSDVFICENNISIDKESICDENSLCDTSLCTVKTHLPYQCQEYRKGEPVYATQCDGRPECPVHVDDECESNCDTVPSYCNRSTRCDGLDTIKDPLILCDGKIDCPNGADELSCPTRTYCNISAENTTIDKNQLCDFNKDCEGWQDELNCTGRLYCDGGPIQGIRPHQIGDGYSHCPNREDECDTSHGTFSSGQWMISWPPVLAAIWIMALLALLGNGVVIVTCAKDLRETYHRGEGDSRGVRVGVCNKTLVLNLALADFLMGVYLLILGIKAIEYNSVYCIKGPEWRSSLLCSRIGALAMLSSQASVLIMVMMTTFRFYSVWSPFRAAERLKARFLVASVVILCWVPPLVLAIVPLHLVNSMAFAVLLKWRMPFSNSILVEKSEFSRIVQGLREDYGDGKLLGGSGWSDLIGDFCRVFKEVCPENHMDIVKRTYPYYSADSVCLPRLFPQIDDSGWSYTAGVIIFDFVAFVYILFAYVMMYVSTVRTNETRNENVTFRRSKEDRVIWQRISRLLITDFLCWMPICITCMISLAGNDIPPIMYQISAAIFLPINSALNPLLYSNAVCKLLRRLGCVGWPNANCGRKPEKIEPHTNGALGTDNVQLETRSLTLSETDRNRNNIISVTSPPSPRRSPRSAFLQSLARLKRLCSERQTYDVTEEDTRYGPRGHRPKSQSTTSTSTTFTTCGQDA